MKYALQVFDEVYTDMHDAKEWYKSQRANLDDEFAEAIEVRYKNIRIAHPKRFPYNIHYYIDQSRKTIIVTAIVHGRRRGALAKKRVTRRIE